MTFKQFNAWCNDRACDGCWGMITALTCIDLIRQVKKIPFWKREKEWKKNFEDPVLTEIVNVNPIKKIKDMKERYHVL